MANALGLPRATGRINNLAKSIRRIRLTHCRHMIADQTGRHAGLLCQRLCLIGGEDQADRGTAHHMTELDRAEKGRERHGNLACERTGKLSDHPANPVWSVDANSAVGLILKVGSKRGHYGKEFAAGQLTVLITYRQ